MQLLRNRIGDADVYSKVSREAWFIICASMDALEDTHHAILAFLPSMQPLDEKAIGERYLCTYGVMQAFAVQQDAIVNLTTSLGFVKPDLARLAHIRDFRIASVGYPTLKDRPKHKPTSSHFIAQVTLDHRGFELFSVSASGKEEHRFVAVPDLAHEQEAHILDLLRAPMYESRQKHPV